MGVLSLARGTYPSLGGIYLGQGGTLLGWRYVLCLEYPSLAGELPTFARGYLPWLVRYLPWPGGTYPQVVKKMSNVKKSNTWTMEEVPKKINSHNEVHTY